MINDDGVGRRCISKWTICTNKHVICLWLY